MTPVIEVESVSKRFRIPLDRSATLKYRLTHPRTSSRYQSLLALDDVSFVVPQGQFAGIVGHNGSGKSTLLKILSRIYRPTSGTVMITGRVSPFLELGVGFNPELTARENVLLNGAVLGITRSELKRRMEEIIHFAELEHFVDTKLKNYSSGMQVRLAFTVAIQADAAILLMDEVLAVGDARFQAKCFDIFNSYKREGRTIVLVTHDLGAVDLYCDRAILLDHGKHIADGVASDVTGRYRRMVGELQDSDRMSQGAIGSDPDGLSTSTRWGNGDVRITDVRLLRSDGSRHSSFTSDEPMMIVIKLEARSAVDDLVIGLGFHRADGSVLGGTNTHVMRVPIPPLREHDQLELQYAVPRIPLLSGTYRLTVAAHPAAQTSTYDWLEQAFEFSVTDESGRAGLFEFGGQWKVVRQDGGLPQPTAIGNTGRQVDNAAAG